LRSRKWREICRRRAVPGRRRAASRDAVTSTRS
jgi:hypothetical protein